MADIMIDLETMGNSADAAIIAIGAVAFDCATNETGPQFYRTIDLASAVRYGGVMDTDTVLWWMKQSDQARGAFGRGGDPIDHVLTEFAYWLGRLAERKLIQIWGNGAAFDNVILSQAYRRLRLPVPWDFWNDRCYRTIKAQNPQIKIDRDGTHHNALDDAISQARHLMRMIGQPANQTHAAA
jgi:exodeoxyribonuclease VIII